MPPGGHRAGLQGAPARREGLRGVFVQEEGRLPSCRSSPLSPHLFFLFLSLQVVKVFENRLVERLVVTAPCNFNLHLAMPRLVEVVVDRPEQGLCTYFNSPVQVWPAVPRGLGWLTAP